ncbi:ribonuclease 3 [Gigaspora margarita]|uniref:Ribonuclease 3 n=1 Tax=Gigaspora margarita TaxID=4874 RepID=A0A8H3WXB2_GIGMA|nr:ribonuclease 3 [Gigaspora margarita]
MTTTQAYFGPHTQVYTNEINFLNSSGFLKPDHTQHTIKQRQKPQKRFVTPVTPAPKNGKKEKGFESMQKRALEELIDALKKALERFNKYPPKFQNNDDYMTIVHVRSYFDKAISNLEGDDCEYQSSSKARHVIEGTPPKSSWRAIVQTKKNEVLTKLDNHNVSNDIGIGSSRSNNKTLTISKGTEIGSSSGFNNQLSIISRKGDINSSQTNKRLIGNTLELPMIIDYDDGERDFKGCRDFPILLDSDDDEIKDLRVLNFDKNEVIVIDDDDEEEINTKDLKRKALPSDSEDGEECSNKKFKSAEKVEDNSLGDFIPLEPITLSDLNEPERVFIRSDFASNAIYELEVRNLQEQKNFEDLKNLRKLKKLTIKKTSSMTSDKITKIKKNLAEINSLITSNRYVKNIKNLRTDLPPIPPILDPCFASMAVGYRDFNKQWEALEFLGDRVLTCCLLKVAKNRYAAKYCEKDIRKGVSVMATNKILAAYTVTLGLQKLNDMDLPMIVKSHADAFEAYFGAYYLACGDLATYEYLKELMTPLFDRIVKSIASGDKHITVTCNVASDYFSMPWINSEHRLR